MHLIDVRSIDEGIDSQVFNVGAGFFEGLASGSLFNGLAVFHETCGQGPVPLARLDGASAQQHLSAPGGQAPGNNIGVLIMNGLAVVADITQARIALRDMLAD